MNTVKRHLSFFLVSLIATGLVACTDRRIPIRKIPVKINNQLPPQSLIEVADVRYNDQDTTVWTMVNKNDSIYVTGTPFGFAKWEVGPDPESPQLTFAVATQIDLLKPRWVAPWYASGTMAVLGNYAFMSGSVGASVMDMSSTGSAKEVLRYPDYDDAADTATADEAFIWSSASFHPSKPLLYAFRQQDFVLTYSFGNSGLKLLTKESYGGDGETMCCVNGTTVFQNSIYIAFRSRLVMFDFGSNGALTNGREFEGLQATYVTASSRYLYVMHEPTQAGSGPVYPGGIYVFDAQGNNVAYLPSEAKIFAVNNSDTHLYANEDDTSVKIYQIQWTR